LEAEQAPLSWELGERLAQEEALTVLSIGRERERVEELDRMLDGYLGPKPVVLKGNTASLGISTDHLRYTGDLDLLVSDDEPISNLLRENGFRQLVDHMPHEYEPLVKGEHFHVDLHAYFPVWTVPAGAPASALEHPVHMGDWVNATALTYDAVAASARPHPWAERSNVLMPGLEAAALILALHIAHDAVELVPNASRPHVRLAELFELRDLIDDPGFDARTLDRLVADARADAPWTQVLELCEYVSNSSNDLLCQSTEIGAVRQPRWGTLWYTRTEVRELLSPPDGVERMCKSLGSDPIQMGSAARWYATFFDTDARPLKHVLVSDAAVPNFGFRLSWTRTAGGSTLVIESNSAPGPFLEEIVIEFATGSVYAAWEVSRSGYRLDAGGHAVEAHWTAIETGWRCDLVLPVSIHADYFDESGTTPAVISCVSFRDVVGSDWTEFLRHRVVSATVLANLDPHVAIA